VTRVRSRRGAGIVVLALTAVMFAGTARASAETTTPSAGPKTHTPIKHFVTVMQEGHTFDNYFGSFPGAAGIPAGTCVPVSPPALRPCVKPSPLGDRPLHALVRSQAAFQTAQANGAMNGFISAQSRNGITDDQAMGIYQGSDVTYYWNLAKQNVLFDQFFSTAPGGSLPNHLAWVAGTAARTAAESIPPSGFGDLPTVFDQLEAKGVSWKFYVQNYDPTVTFRRAPGAARREQVIRVPLLAYARYVDDPNLFAHIVPVSEYFDDLRHGTLPAVSYIVPSGPSERAPTNVQSGARFVQSLVGALTASSAWSTSAFVLTYDDWGGYYDHVTPKQTGFRVPTLVMGAYSRRGFVDHTALETASIPGFIAENWGLPPLSPNDGNLTSAFDFTAATRRARVIGPTTLPAPAPASLIGVVFVLYGIALAAALLVFSAVAWRARRRTEVVLP
jgi:phospholipase C